MRIIIYVAMLTYAFHALRYSPIPVCEREQYDRRTPVMQWLDKGLRPLIRSLITNLVGRQLPTLEWSEKSHSLLVTRIPRNVPRACSIHRKQQPAPPSSHRS